MYFRHEARLSGRIGISYVSLSGKEIGAEAPINRWF